ncbi:MAG: O-methyltransferase [Candidatus Zixiibacteriota bacterium]
MDVTEPRLDDYMLQLISETSRADGESEVLSEMERHARDNDFPIIGPLVGRFLRQLAIVTGAKGIFEMGSGFGYSAYWFARGLAKGGKIICTDGSEDNKHRALDYLKRAGYESLVEFHVGDAREIIRRFGGPFDIILNDIDKEQYPETLDLAIPHLRKGGMFITDNVLWSGRILEEDPDEASRGILEFNRRLFESQEVLASIIPIRDGLGIAVKL